MQVKCPQCGYTGNIADKLVPDEGRNVSCPKCKTSIFIRADAPIELPESEPQTFTVSDVDPNPVAPQRGATPQAEAGPKAVQGSLITIDKHIFTKLAAIAAAVICIGAGIYLALVEPAVKLDEGEGRNVLFTICNGMGYYFIAKGIFIGFALWNIAKIREGQEKRA